MEELTANLTETNLDSVATEENTVITTAKAGLAAAITSKGVATDKTASFSQMSKNIDKIKTAANGGSYVKQYFITEISSSHNYVTATAELT